jgi:hypothetical protein
MLGKAQAAVLSQSSSTAAFLKAERGKRSQGISRAAARLARLG